MILICMTILLVTALMFSLFAAYFAKRTGLTAADAAAAGALQALSNGLPDAFDEVVQPRVEAFWKAVGQDMDEWDEQEQKRQEACEAKRLEDPEYEGPECEEPEPAARREFWLDTCEKHNNSVGREMCLAQEKGKALGRLPLIKGFLTAEERGCVVVQPGDRVTNEMLARADSYSRRNGGPGVGRSNFEFPFRADPSEPYQPIVLIHTEQRISALVMDRQGLPEGIPGAMVRAVVGLYDLDDLEPVYPDDLATCGGLLGG